MIAPLMPAKHTWPAEAAKWDHTKDLRVSLVMGTAKERERAVRTSADLYVVNRESAAAALPGALTSAEFEQTRTVRAEGNASGQGGSVHE